MSNQVRAKLLRQLAALDEKRMNDPGDMSLRSRS